MVILIWTTGLQCGLNDSMASVPRFSLFHLPIIIIILLLLLLLLEVGISISISISRYYLAT